MSIKELFERLISMPIKNMIGYVALIAMINLIGFSIMKAFNPSGDSNKLSNEYSKEADKADKALVEATANRLRREALGSK